MAYPGVGEAAVPTVGDARLPPALARLAAVLDDGDFETPVSRQPRDERALLVAPHRGSRARPLARIGLAADADQHQAVILHPGPGPAVRHEVIPPCLGAGEARRVDLVLVEDEAGAGLLRRGPAAHRPSALVTSPSCGHPGSFIAQSIIGAGAVISRGKSAGPEATGPMPGGPAGESGARTARPPCRLRGG